MVQAVPAAPANAAAPAHDPVDSSRLPVVECIHGSLFDGGYLSPYFITNPTAYVAELEKPFILIYEDKIRTAQSLGPLLEAVMRKKRPLLIFAEDVDTDPLAVLVVNQLKKVIQVCAVKLPSSPERRTVMLQDLAALTGGRAIFKAEGVQLEQVRLSDLGRARQVRIDAQYAIIIGGKGPQTVAPARITWRSYLRSVAALAWGAFRHPFKTTFVDLSTGRAIHD
jgi:chaperonin GroEL